MVTSSILFKSGFPLTLAGAADSGHCQRCERTTSWTDHMVAYACVECGNDPVVEIETATVHGAPSLTTMARRKQPLHLIRSVRSRIGAISGTLRPAA